MLLFATDDHLRLLASSKTGFMDGTFKVCPSLYYQLFTIHGVVEEAIVPLVYVLLTQKMRTAYFDMLSKLRKQVANLHLSFNQDVIVTDFDSSTIEAARQHFPRVRQIGCFFHFCQSVW